MFARLTLLFVSCHISIASNDNDYSITILTNGYPKSHNSDLLKKTIFSECEKNNKKCSIDISDRDFEPPNKGFWTIWPLLTRLFDKSSTNWYIFVEENSEVDLKILDGFLSSKDSSQDLFFGHGLRDESYTIIHHFYGGLEGQSLDFKYPDLGCGIVLSRSLVEKIIKKLENVNPKQFSIDAKHELALYILEQTSVSLTSVTEIFCYDKKVGCAIWLNVKESCPGEPLSSEKIYVGVKTFRGYHVQRIPVVKRTWGKKFLNIEYVSDIDDGSIPTISLKVSNTEKGHCAKTMAIIDHFLELQNDSNNPFHWLLIADDDTLISAERLIDMLSCYDPKEKIIIGERYGFGFTPDGRHGYDYPTGGSGMIFSMSAATTLAGSCICPLSESPDDMIIGICASTEKIPIVHNAGMHQARPSDYAQAYIKRQKPISFHKFTEIDPYKVYNAYLRDDRPPQTNHLKTEL